MTLAAGKQETSVYGLCTVYLDVFGEHHVDEPLKVLDSLCTDIILGIDFLSKHKSLGTWNLEMAVVTLINTAGGAKEAALKLSTRVCSPEYQGTRPPWDISG